MKVKPVVLRRKFFYEACGDASGKYRWWDSGKDVSDSFDMLKDDDELKVRLEAAKIANIPVVSHLPAFCGNCPECESY